MKTILSLPISTNSASTNWSRTHMKCEGYGWDHANQWLWPLTCQSTACTSSVIITQTRAGTSLPFWRNHSTTESARPSTVGGQVCLALDFSNISLTDATNWSFPWTKLIFVQLSRYSLPFQIFHQTFRSLTALLTWYCYTVVIISRQYADITTFVLAVIRQDFWWRLNPKKPKGCINPRPPFGFPTIFFSFWELDRSPSATCS